MDRPVSFSAKVIAHSTSYHGKEIVSFELMYPRFIHAEFMTHRDFSRNAGSSRATPIKDMISAIAADMAKPVHWGAHQPGMQAHSELDPHNTWVYDPQTHEKVDLVEAWERAGHDAVSWARNMAEAGVHKQVVNRLIEPYSHIKVLVTATEWNNFFTLRYHPDAQPEIQHLAQLMWDAKKASEPDFLEEFEWHLPYVTLEERTNSTSPTPNC